MGKILKLLSNVSLDPQVSKYRKLAPKNIFKGEIINTQGLHVPGGTQLLKSVFSKLQPLSSNVFKFEGNVSNELSKSTVF